MIKNVLKVFGIFILAIVQLALFSKLSVLGAIPNIVLVLIVALGLKGRFQEAVLTATIGGIILDLASPLRFGAYTVLMLGIALLIQYVVIKIVPPPDFYLAFTVFAGSILFFDLILSLFVLTWPRWILISDLFLNGFLGLGVLWLMTRIIRPENEIKLT